MVHGSSQWRTSLPWSGGAFPAFDCPVLPLHPLGQCSGNQNTQYCDGHHGAWSAGSSNVHIVK